MRARIGFVVILFIVAMIAQAQDVPQRPLSLQVVDAKGKVFGSLLQYNMAVRTLPDGAVIAVEFSGGQVTPGYTYYEDSTCSTAPWMQSTPQVPPSVEWIPGTLMRPNDTRLYYVTPGSLPVQRTFHSISQNGRCVTVDYSTTARPLSVAFDTKGYTPPFHVIAK